MFILTYIIKTTVALILFYLLYVFVLKRNSSLKFNRYYLLFSLISSFILPFIQLSYVAAPEAQVSKFFTEQSTSYIPGLNELDNNIESQKSNDISIRTESRRATMPNLTSILKWVVLVLYGSGIAVLLASFLYQLWQTLFLIRDNKKEHFSKAKLIQHNLDLMPFSVFNYIVINKNQYDEKELDYVLRHEMQHIGQKHSIDIAIIELLKIFFWINPLLWIYEKEIKQNHEYLADRGVVEQGIQTKDYLLILLNISLGVPKYSIVNSFNQSFIKSRIAMMTQKKLNRLPLWKVALIAPVIIAILFAFSKPVSSQAANNEGITDFTKYIELNTPYDWVSYSGANIFCNGTYMITKINDDGSFVGIQSNHTNHALISVTGKLTKNQLEFYTSGPWQEIWAITTAEDGKLAGRIFADYSLARRNKLTFYLAKHIGYDELLPAAQSQPGEEISKNLHLKLNEKYFYETFNDNGELGMTGWFMITNFDNTSKEISGRQWNYRGNSDGVFSGSLDDDNITINIGEPWNEVWKAKLEGDLLKGTLEMNPTAEGFVHQKSIHPWVMANINHPIISQDQVEKLKTPYNTARYSEMEQNLQKLLSENMKYPEKAKKDSIEGKVYVSFTVLTDGSISNVEVARKVNPLLDDEAKRLVNLTTKKWVPALIDNRPVESDYLMPIVFKLK